MQTNGQTNYIETLNYVLKRRIEEKEKILKVTKHSKARNKIISQIKYWKESL